MKVCQQCGVHFEETNPQQIYCNDTHARRARRNRSRAEKRSLRRERRLNCPTPQKLVFPNRDSTWAYIFKRHLPVLVPYKCPCLMWHMKTVSVQKRRNVEDSYLRRNDSVKKNSDQPTVRPSLAEARKNTPF